MFKLIGLLFKIAIFGVVVLIIGNTVHWGGRTISDQIRIGLSSAQKSTMGKQVQGWATGFVNEARKGSLQAAPGQQEAPDSENIPHSERQKLRALIKEINGDQSKSEKN
jgi:hypothetical protein